MEAPDGRERGRTLLLVGAGPIGLAASSAAVDDGVATVVGVVDPDPEARESAQDLLDCPGFASLPIRVGKVADVAIVAFSSNAVATAPTVLSLLENGCHVVTTCEGLAFPDTDIAQRLTTAATANDVSVVVTGANPGFVMDRLASVVALAGRNVREVSVTRRLDTRTRRGPLVAKTGRGLTEVEFRALAAAGRLGHMGLPESARLIADALGWREQDLTSTLEPVLDGQGEVLGQHQLLTLQADAGRRVVMDLEMSWGAESPGDSIAVRGEFDLDVEVKGGYPGDKGTTAMVVRAVDGIERRMPGFHRPTDYR